MSSDDDRIDAVSQLPSSAEDAAALAAVPVTVKASGPENEERETSSAVLELEPRPPTTEDTSAVESGTSNGPSSDQPPPSNGAARGPTPGRPDLTNLMEIEGRMREQIRRLQEQRAAAMMGEIVALQRERDMAMGRIRQLERSVAGRRADAIIIPVAYCKLITFY